MTQSGLQWMLDALTQLREAHVTEDTLGEVAQIIIFLADCCDELPQSRVSVEQDGVVLRAECGSKKMTLTIKVPEHPHLIQEEEGEVVVDRRLPHGACEVMAYAARWVKS